LNFNVGDAFRSPHLLNVSEETVKTVLEIDLVSLDSETRLLSALIDWGRAQVLREEGIAPDDEQPD
jgi:hypothetical protein